MQLSNSAKISGAYNSNSYQNLSMDSRRLPSANDNKLSLTPLWEYVVRTKSLPDNLNLDIFFQAIFERLRNPEREVRQHALRVLTDFIPVIPEAQIDDRMETLMPDLVSNLANISPSVRKGSIDCIRAYLNNSKNSDRVIKGLVFDGLENKTPVTIVVGIIIALPFFFTNADEESQFYIIKTLFDKMVQITYQEVTLRSLVKIKDIIGDQAFKSYINNVKNKRDFEILCDVYKMYGKNSEIENNKIYWSDLNQNIVEESRWRSNNNYQIVVREQEGEIIEDKVILETEIKLNSGPAITMQIHEESRQVISDGEMDDHARNASGIVKVLTDESEEDYEPRRTPRRVRFGGEIVKLRTPDSDSNQTSDLDSTEQIITINNLGENPSIQINYNRDTNNARNKSQIPVLNRKASRSEPSSPIRRLTSKAIFNSSPNLESKMQSKIPIKKISENTTTIQIKFTDFTQNKGTIRRDKPMIDKTMVTKPSQPKNKTSVSKPRGRGLSPNPSHNGIEIFHNLTRSPERTTPEPPEASRNPEGKSIASKEKPGKSSCAKKDDNLLNGINGRANKIININQTVQKSSPPFVSSKNDKKLADVVNKHAPRFSRQSRVGNTKGAKPTKEEPILPSIAAKYQTIHVADKAKAKKTNPNEISSSLTNPKQTIAPKDERQLSTADKVLLNRQNNLKLPRKIRTADQLNKTAVLPAINGSYNSFKVCSSTLYDSSAGGDSSIPTNDNGECLTCSSSGSDSTLLGPETVDSDNMNYANLNDFNCRDDWRLRQRDLEQLKQLLTNNGVPNVLEENSSTVLHFLFTCEQFDRLQCGSEEALHLFFSKMKIQSLESNLTQIVKSLCKMGSPAGVRLSIILIKRIGAAKFVECMLKGTVFSAKSSKIREGALQILMCIARICPSTDINVPKTVEIISPLLNDRKKRIRRAVLETIAAMAHISTSGDVLAIIGRALDDNLEKEHLTGVVRTRLSRKQLTTVGQNGIVRYSTPTGEMELHWISGGSASSNSVQSPDGSTERDPENESVGQSIGDNELQRSPDKIVPCKISNRYPEGDEGNRNPDTDESDWSRQSDERPKDERNGKALQLWAVDPWTLSTPVTLSTANGTLRPLYLVQNEQYQGNSNSGCYNKTKNVLKQRGRSCSPPKRAEASQQNIESERFFSAVDRSSVDNIRTVGIQLSSNSASSSNSGGSESAAVWNRTFKSGIPVPVTSDSKIRLRGARHGDNHKGPMSIPSRLYRAKSPSPLCTPERNLATQRAIIGRQPFCPESEPCEFYTPPAEPHLATPCYKENTEDIILESPRPSESSIQVDSPRYHNENFTVLDDSPPDVLDCNETSILSGAYKDIEDEQEHQENEDKESEVELNHCFEETIFNNEYHLEERSEYPSSSELDTCIELEDNCRTSACGSLYNLDNLDTSRSFVSKSKSEINLQSAAEASRKTINSAPALNELLNQAHYEPFNEPASISNTILPGSTSEFVPQREVQTPKLRTPRAKSLCRIGSIRASKREVTPFPDSLGPFTKPREGYNEALALLDSNEWELTIKGLQGIVRLSRHHPDIIENQMHSVCVALGKQVKNLRSQVSRAACLASSEMFVTHRRALEVDLEELAVPLLHRTADTNKFLRCDANNALDSMCTNIAIPKVVSVVATKGGCHQNAIVRCAAARILSTLTNRLGSEKIFQLPRDTRDKILFSGANMLMEGNLDTRKHAKIMFGNLLHHGQFYRAMSEAVPATTMRHIQKTLKNLQ